MLQICVMACVSAAVAKPHLRPSHLKRLENWEVISFGERHKALRIPRGKAIGVINDVPEAVVYVLTHIEELEHFIPRIKNSRVTKRTGYHTYAVLHSDLPWPVKDAWVYIKMTRYDKPGRVYAFKWWMLNGTMRRYQGEALIEPWDKAAKKTVITFSLSAEPVTAAPDALVIPGVKQIAETFVHRIRMRLKALRKHKKLPAGM